MDEKSAEKASKRCFGFHLGIRNGQESMKRQNTGMEKDTIVRGLFSYMKARMLKSGEWTYESTEILSCKI